MEKADTQIAAHISPEKKLSFLQIVFDRLDPNFIQALLQKYQWSVDAALDELLSAEEARSAQEEQQRLTSCDLSSDSQKVVPRATATGSRRKRKETYLHGARGLTEEKYDTVPPRLLP